MEDTRDRAISPRSVDPTSTATRSRSYSDPPNAPAAALAPSPNFRETLRRTSKDDYSVPTTPTMIRRPDLHGLSLQMAARDMPSPAQLHRPAAPLSPQLDAHNIHAVQAHDQAASPITSLPRHSRGLDFSRASTNLHHSTLAEQRSPDLSPIITQRGVNIPSRKMSVSSMALDSPNVGLGGMWSSLGQGRSAVSSSVGSVNMMLSDTSSDSSDEDASMGYDDNDDPIITTPQVHKLHNQSVATPFATASAIEGSVFGGTNAQSPAAASLLRTIRKSRLNKPSKRPKKGSSSASNNSALASPRTTSPPPMRSIEGPGYFGWPKSRRESLALGTDSLHLSSGNDSGDEGAAAPNTPGVVRRPVTRRSNLLPKTKGFARIRATLAEEATPIDTDTRREAETIRQVRERDNGSSVLDLEPTRYTDTAPSSPALLPAVPELAQAEFGQELDPEATPMSKGLGVNFQLHAHRNSAGPNFWNRFDSSAGTPPPPNFPPTFSRQSSTVNSDAVMDSPSMAPHDTLHRVRGRAHSSASDISDVMALNGSGAQSGTNVASGISDDMHIKKLKRRREDDFDISTIKRRAVSPGLSAQNSPVLTQSPYQRDGSTWGYPPERKRERELTTGSSDASMSSSQIAHPNRSSSNGSSGTPSGLNQGKKLGQKGMADTNDGLMKMSIE